MLPRKPRFLLVLLDRFTLNSISGRLQAYFNSVLLLLLFSLRVFLSLPAMPLLHAYDVSVGWQLSVCFPPELPPLLLAPLHTGTADWDSAANPFHADAMQMIFRG